MAEEVFEESAYNFNENIRYFKANDPYYFEVDNIPLKQLQENCMWLKDQLRQQPTGLASVKRADFEELKPYATGGDRLVRVKPGRYTARVNDASTKEPLSFLTKIAGDEVAEMDQYNVTIPQTNATLNQRLLTALETFKSSVESASLGSNGLETRVFTWPIQAPEFPIGIDGLTLDSSVDYVKYNFDVVSVISQALLWAVGLNQEPNSFLVTLYDPIVDPDYSDYEGLRFLPRLESNFIKYWRGVARTAVVDVDTELTIEVPTFDADDFSYVDSNGNEIPVNGVTSRVDLVFIYTKPIDASSTTILKPSGKEVITKPQLGIVRGAGIKTTFSSSEQQVQNIENGIKQTVTDEHKILASPGDSNNPNLGFTATSGNDIAFDVRGSFPAPDDILNLAPLLSERLEESAIELVGQSILPVAYVWVKDEGTPLTNGSVAVLETDVIDIRPFFRTTELAYNERAGIAAAIPQLSLANPAVGRVQLDYEFRRLKNEFSVNLENFVTNALANIAPTVTEYVPLYKPYLFYNGNNADGNGSEGVFENTVPPPGQGAYFSNANATNESITTKFGTREIPRKWIIPEEFLSSVINNTPMDTVDDIVAITFAINTIEGRENGFQAILGYTKDGVPDASTPADDWHKLITFGLKLDSADTAIISQANTYTLPITSRLEESPSGPVPKLVMYTAGVFAYAESSSSSNTRVYISITGYYRRKPLFISF